MCNSVNCSYFVVMFDAGEGLAPSLFLSCFLTFSSALLSVKNCFFCHVGPWTLWMVSCCQQAGYITDIQCMMASAVCGTSALRPSAGRPHNVCV